MSILDMIVNKDELSGDHHEAERNEEDDYAARVYEVSVLICFEHGLFLLCRE